ncbi:MAG: lipid A deacylase LpxR family protein [Thermoanaerobaculia bacterium]|nr:lipid A deacylase LpxR family protein [Thermoanaerobaculia bacterium]
MPRAARLLALTATFASALIVGEAKAEEPEVLDRKMLRFEFDNDILSGSDDAFTAGWSLQLHSGLLESWEGPLAPLGRVPGLGDDGDSGRAVRWAVGLTQTIVTPRDITVAEAQPEDWPWAGILGIFGSFTSFDNQRLVAAQVFLGCMGPCSHADSVQRFAHEDLGLSSDSPAGWDNQLEDQVLANLNLGGRYKLWSPQASAYVPGRWASDYSVGAQVGLGNLATFVGLQIEARFGWGLPMGFTHLPDPPGIGIALDPVYADREGRTDRPERRRFYASVAVRARAWDRLAPAEGGRTENGGIHPGVDGNLNDPVILVGFHVARIPFAFNATYFRYVDEAQSGNRASATLDWMNLSFEVRF